VDDRFNNETAIRPRTDDGLAYMLGAVFHDGSAPFPGEIRFADDYAAIQWMRGDDDEGSPNVRGSPTILEGVTPNYRWGSRFANNTGLPAVSAWDWHQVQQRDMFSGIVNERRREVDLFYTTGDPAEAQSIIKKHDVRYVVVGALERLYYPADGIAKLESGLGGMLHRVFQSGETSIYEVVPGVALASR
jgi:uncharacterized membrane protein